MQRILVSNDDGINALGIRKLVEALLSLDEVEIFVVAPIEERSGVGHGITYRSALTPTPHDFYGLPVKAWGINGNPADCVKAAYFLLFEDGKKPDIVFSGINVGSNLGRDVYYSGTCSAAREAVILGVPAAALSYDNWESKEDFEQVAEVIRPLLAELCAKAKNGQFPRDVFWNVNIPYLKRTEVKGIVPAGLALHHYLDKYHPKEEGFLLEREYPETGSKEQDDYHLLKSGHITVTPIHIDSTERSLLATVKEWPVVKNWQKG